MKTAELRMIPVSELKPAEYNPRKKLKPGDKEYEKIKNSIEEFGFADPLVVNADMTIIGGHQRLTVAMALGYTEVPCAVVDIDKVREKALNIALNKITGAWDENLLAELLEDIQSSDFDLGKTGFDPPEIEQLFNQVHDKQVNEDSFDIEDIRRCSAKYVRDDVLKAAFVTMLNKLIFSRKLILKPLYDTLRADSTDESIKRMQELQQMLEKNSEKKHTLRQLRAQDIIDNVMFNQEMNMLRKAAEDYRNELAVLGTYTSAEAYEITELDKLLKFTETTALLDEFSDELFTAFVDHIIVYDRDCIEFKLKCGLTLKEVL